MIDLYQSELAAFAVEHKLQAIVETGLGVSTVKLLEALDTMGAGHLTSVDPEPWYDGKISHPRHTWRRGTAVEVLPQLEWPWDLFLHDSDHDIFNQTFEFAFAWGMVRKGGWIACDDYTWGQHKAWQRFVEQHKLEPVKMGSIELVQKTDEPARPDKIRLIQQAEQAEREWFAKGGKNTSVFAKWRTNAR